MNKLYILSIALFIACFIFSCKKDDSAKTQNSQLITGKWLIDNQNMKVYDLNTNELLKDTTLFFTPTSAKGRYEIYNVDGSAYYTTTPYKKAGSTSLSVDTTSYLHYTILGSNLTLKQNGGGSETDPIIKLTQAELQLESTYNNTPAAGWGLDISSEYKFVESNHFIKQ